jgi:RNA polymerase sigma-70 factor, ECF subfamily
MLVLQKKKNQVRSLDNDFTKVEAEEYLIKQLKDGDEQAYSQLFDRYSAMMYGVILRIVQDEADAQNLLQDTFVKIWANIQSYDAARGRLATWLLNIARNTAIDFTRSKVYAQRRRSDSLDITLVAEKDSLKTQTLVDVIGLKQIVHSLTPQYREIIEWMYFEGFTQQEISDEKGIPLGTVKTRARLALIELRRSFKV